MRAHKAIEAIQKKGTSALGGIPAHMLDFGQFVQFDFGDITPIPTEEWVELQDYALELINAGMFELPFIKCFYSYKADGCDFSISIEDAGDSINLLSIWFSELSVPVIASYASMKKRGTSRFDVYSNVNVVDRALFANSRHRSISEQDHLKETCVTFARCLAALTTLLSATGIEQVITKAPEKLNKARAKAGKPLISDVRQIIIRHNKKVYLTSGLEQGSHASPRMHWRRGHIRRLSSGKIANVRPCLVGTVGEARQPSYVVEVA